MTGQPLLILDARRRAGAAPLEKGGGSDNVLLPSSLALRLIWLERVQDVSGHSGTGIVAGGIVFPNGRCVLRWYTDTSTIVLFDSPEQVATIHGHDGATRVWLTSEISSAQWAEEVV